MTTFELPGCVDMWTVLSGDQVIELVSIDYDNNVIQYNPVKHSTVQFYKTTFLCDKT